MSQDYLNYKDDAFNEKAAKINENGNYFKLAEVAYDGNDFEEAINYYNKCLEIDSDFYELWYKKGLSVIKTSKVGNFKSAQAVSAFKQALDNAPDKSNFLQRLKHDVIPFVCNYYVVAFNHYEKFISTSNAGAEFALKIERANACMNFILDNAEVTIDEVKSIYESVNKVSKEIVRVVVKATFSKEKGDNSTAPLDSIRDLRDKRLLVLWEKMEPSTLPKKKGCFIATATMDNYDHPVVKDLRLFRDQWLLKRVWGVKFTDWYYKNGPYVADIIKNSKFLKRITYVLLIKPLHLITKSFFVK